jgi:hypothetical protein
MRVMRAGVVQGAVLEVDLESPVVLVVRVVSPAVIQKSKPSNELGFLLNRRADCKNREAKLVIVPY